MYVYAIFGTFACFSLPLQWYSNMSLVTQIDGKKCGIFMNNAYVVFFFFQKKSFVVVMALVNRI